jgi:hypothetical protein
MYYAILIVLVIVILIALTYYNNRVTFKTACTQSDGRCYKVASGLGDTHIAAGLLSRLNADILKLIRHMRDSYLWNKKYIGSNDPAIILRKILVTHMLYRYNADQLVENIPRRIGETSFTQEKGKMMALCMRDKDKKIEDYEILLFVGLHELSHIATNIRDHEEPFWFVFQVILKEAKSVGIYHPIDHRINPISTCGLKVQYNPYFDTRLHESKLYGILDKL